jgi:pimeloyl-ACP methyl ester carboxylesterase
MFSKEKLYLVGHSWGSVLGLFFIQRYPELVEKYVGCGQVVNMKKQY